MYFCHFCRPRRYSLSNLLTAFLRFFALGWGIFMIDIHFINHNSTQVTSFININIYFSRFSISLFIFQDTLILKCIYLFLVDHNFAFSSSLFLQIYSPPSIICNNMQAPEYASYAIMNFRKNFCIYVQLQQKTTLNKKLDENYYDAWLFWFHNILVEFILL